MKNLAELSNEELLSLQQSVADWLSTVSRKRINQQFRVGNYQDRQLSAFERLQSATTEADTIETILVSLKNAGADAKTIAEYENKQDLALLRKRLAEANATRYSEVILQQLGKETQLLEHEEQAVQDFASEVAALIV